MATRGNTKLPGFYFPWPLRGIQLARQIDQSRENTFKLAPLTRAAYVDAQPVTANDPGNHDLAGWAIGMRDFRNKFRIWYDQDNGRFTIQHNIGTEAVETWDDMITIRESDGRVTIVQDGGLEAEGGFYNELPRNLATSGRFSPASQEWAFTHNLNTKPVLWDTFNLEDKSIIPQSVDVSDPNIAYFYFSSPQAGFAVVTGEQARFSGIRVDDGNGNIFPTATRLGFNGAEFYASTDGHGMPVINLEPLDFSNSDTSTLPVNLVVEDSGLSQVFDMSTLAIPAKLVFNQVDFYLRPDNQGNPIINIRGGAGGGGGSSGQFGTGIFAKDFTSSNEWVLNHGLGVANIIWSVFDDQGLAVIPQKVSVHDNNIAYFYFNPALAGRAVVGGGPIFQSNSGSISVDETDGNPSFSSVSDIIFNSGDFYLTPDSTGKPIVNFRGTASGGGNGLQNVVEDLSPQLGGDLDVNGFEIISVASSAINIIGGAGAGATDGSSINATAGNTEDGRGGNVNITGGSATVSGTGGNVNIQSGTGAAGPDSNGDISFSSSRDFLVSVNRDISIEGNGNVVINTNTSGTITVGGNLNDSVLVMDQTSQSGRLHTGRRFYIDAGDVQVNTVNDIRLHGFNILLGADGQIDLQSGGLVTINATGLDLNNSIIQNVLDPSGPQDAATKNYVDSQISGGGGGGFYGIVWSDGTVTKRTDRLSFNGSEFYLDGRKPTLNIKESGIDHNLLANLTTGDPHTQYIRVDGTRAFTADQSHGGFKITNLGTPSASTDGATKGYVDTTVGPGFYGVIWKDGRVTKRTDRLSFNGLQFYLDGSSPTVNLADNQTFRTVTFANSVGSTVLDPSGITAQRTLTFPDRSGRFALEDQLNSFYALTVRETDGSPSVKTSALIFNSSDFYLELSSIGQPQVNIRNSTGSGLKIISDGLSTSNNATKLNFSNQDFYLSGGSSTAPTVNLRNSLEPLSAYLDFGITGNVFLETFANPSLIENIQLVCRSGSAIGGFYIIPNAHPEFRDGSVVGGADPITINNTTQQIKPTSNFTLARGDGLKLAIYSNANAKGIRVKVQLKRP